jgi:hypothetical protein
MLRCLALCLLLVPAAAGAGPIEPTFYFGQQYDGPEDSPFAIQHLEDFEDGLFNQPGVTAFSGYSPNALLTFVSFPGEYTNSVDGGHDGHSFVPGIYQTDFVNPPTIRCGLGFEFAELPTNVGMAITRISSPEVSNLVFLVYGPDGEEVGRYQTPASSVSVATPFIGVSYAGGISAVHLVNFAKGGPSAAFQIDHLQYGVPEPNTLVLGLLAALGCAAFVRRR